MNVVKYRKIFFLFSIILLGASVYSLFAYGLNLGSDFVGGVVWELEYANVRPDVAGLKSSTAGLEIPGLSLAPTSDNGLIVKAKVLSEENKDKLARVLGQDGKAVFVEKRFSEVGPVLGKELSRKGLIAISLVVILTILFIAFVFRQVSAHRMASWKYGITAIIALAHDITISTGAMALFGYLYGAEADALFLTALLTILGLSINDTIVVFDRIRENLHRHASNDFSVVVSDSIKETYRRSINTTLTIVFTLTCLLVFGPESTRFFAAVLLVGMTIGTYSSIFIASSLLVEWEAWQTRRALAKAKK